jgi:hypothetical protein
MPLTSPPSDAPTTSGATPRVVPTWGIVVLLVWFVAVSAILVYGLDRLWPPPSSLAGGSTESEVHFFGWKSSLNDDTRLFLLIVVGGGLGAMVSVLRSFTWYVGHGKLFARWVPFYLLRPFVGATLAIVFFLVIRGGFAQQLAQNNSFGFVALAAVIGLFSEQASEKLKEIAETIFKPAPKGAGTAPTASSITPTSGPQGGGTPVTISGSGFVNGATVSFGAQAAQTGNPSDDGKTITATTPRAAQPGHAEVTVKNPDGHSAPVPGGFNYTPSSPPTGPVPGGSPP